MGDIVEVVRLTPRKLEVVLLLGRDGLKYKEAAAQMTNRIMRVRKGTEPPPISHHTVRRYAIEIRDAAGLQHLSPKAALMIYYREHIHKPKEA